MLWKHLSIQSSVGMHIMELGLRRIIKARSMTPSENWTTIRKFIVPELNFNANDYSEIIDWQKCWNCWDFWWNFGKDDSEMRSTRTKQILMSYTSRDMWKQWQRPRLLCVVLRAETDTFGQDLLPAEKCLHSTVNTNIKHTQNNLNLLMSNFMWKLRTF